MTDDPDFDDVAGKLFSSDKIFSKIFNQPPPQQSRFAPAPPQGEALPYIAGFPVNTIVVRPITVVVGRYWDLQARLASSIANDSINKRFTRVLQCPEGQYHISDLINEVLPGIAQSVRKEDVLLLTTNSVPVMEELKSYVRNGKIAVEDLSFLYIHKDTSTEMLHIDPSGEWLKPYPDSTYDITFESLNIGVVDLSDDEEDEDYYDEEEEEEEPAPKQVKCPRCMRENLNSLGACRSCGFDISDDNFEDDDDDDPGMEGWCDICKCYKCYCKKDGKPKEGEGETVDA